MLRILITGGSGLLALNLANHFRMQHHVTLGLHKAIVSLNKTANASLPSIIHDLDDLMEVGNFDAVIHTAGMTDVDSCERNPSEAVDINANLSLHVARSCNKAGVKMVHISTDHLFDGSQSFSDEDAAPSPLNQYGISKLLAEQYVLETLPAALVIRTNFFGWGNQKKLSFSDWIINSLMNNRQVNLFKDVFFNPILISVLAEKIEDLLRLNAKGIFNITSDERLSKYEFGLQLCETFRLNHDLIKATSIEDVGLSALRPKDMSLSNAKLKKVTSSTIPSLGEQLVMLKGQLDTGWADEIRNSLMES